MAWKKTCVWAALFLLLAGGMAVSQEDELADCPYFSGMSSYEVARADDFEFDARQFYDGKSMVAVEGRVWERQYNLKEDATPASGLQIIRNYAAAIRKAGGTVFLEGICQGSGCGDLEGESFVSGRFTKAGKEIWVQVLPQESGAWFNLIVLEKQAMRQEVSANVMFDALSRDGFVALYINFELNKSDIMPESQPIVGQIAQMLRDHPELRVSVEGHTDSTGDAAKNKVLSQQRADAVKAAIVKLGIAAGRLSTFGWGQEKPVADNRSEEGRAKNRRVEIVKKTS